MIDWLINYPKSFRKHNLEQIATHIIILIDIEWGTHEIINSFQYWQILSNIDKYYPTLRNIVKYYEAFWILSALSNIATYSFILSDLVKDCQL